MDRENEYRLNDETSFRMVDSSDRAASFEYCGSSAISDAAVSIAVPGRIAERHEQSCSHRPVPANRCAF